jgi:hypothetical protein
MVDPTGTRWRKSTHSGGNGGECVEVTDNLARVVLDRPAPTGDPGLWPGSFDTSMW